MDPGFDEEGYLASNFEKTRLSSVIAALEYGPVASQQFVNLSHSLGFVHCGIGDEPGCGPAGKEPLCSFLPARRIRPGAHTGAALRTPWYARYSRLSVTHVICQSPQCSRLRRHQLIYSRLESQTLVLEPSPCSGFPVESRNAQYRRALLSPRNRATSRGAVATTGRHTS
jgi:hypothetical protein